MPRFIHASARDGALLLDFIDAPNGAAAREGALKAAAIFHDLAQPIDESDLDGFDCVPLEDLLGD